MANHDLFHLQLRVIGYIMPSYVKLEMTPPDIYNYQDYTYAEGKLTRLGYNCTAINRMPSAYCGDRSSRHRYILVAVRADLSATKIDLAAYIGDAVTPMRSALDHPCDVSDDLWLDEQYFIPRHSQETTLHPNIHDVIDPATWGATGEQPGFIDPRLEAHRRALLSCS